MSYAEDYNRDSEAYEREQERLEDEYYAAQEAFDLHYDYELRTGDKGWIEGMPMG